jgi:hypothetical protein
MANKALTYAEQTLGVHSVYESARNLQSSFEAVLLELKDARASKRSLEEQISEREVDVMIEETTKHPSMSATAMKEHLKKATQKDEALRRYRYMAMDLAGTIDTLEMRKSCLEQETRIEVARLNELGGYLNYLMSIKIASKVSAPHEATEATEAESSTTTIGEPQ